MSIGGQRPQFLLQFAKSNITQEKLPDEKIQYKLFLRFSKTNNHTQHFILPSPLGEYLWLYIQKPWKEIVAAFGKKEISYDYLWLNNRMNCRGIFVSLSFFLIIIMKNRL